MRHPHDHIREIAYAISLRAAADKLRHKEGKCPKMTDVILSHSEDAVCGILMITSEKSPARFLFV